MLKAKNSIKAARGQASDHVSTVTLPEQVVLQT